MIENPVMLLPPYSPRLLFSSFPSFPLSPTPLHAPQVYIYTSGHHSMTWHSLAMTWHLVCFAALIVLWTTWQQKRYKIPIRTPKTSDISNFMHIKRKKKKKEPTLLWYLELIFVQSSIGIRTLKKTRP